MDIQNCTIEVCEDGSKMKLIAYLVDDKGNKIALAKTLNGRDDLLNKIDSVNLSSLPLTFM